MSDSDHLPLDDEIPVDDTDAGPSEEEVTTGAEPPADEKKPKAKRGNSVLDVEHLYTSRQLDREISDIDEYEAVRRQEVEEALAYFDSVRSPLTYQLVEAVQIMERKKADPYMNLRLPESSASVSITDLQDLLARVSNAFMTYGEYMSAVAPLLAMRENLFERRKIRALVNEGTNAEERKALSHLRSEPEFLMKTKVEMLHKFISTRYFAYKAMLEAVQQMLTTKSVDRARQGKDSGSPEGGLL